MRQSICAVHVAMREGWRVRAERHHVVTFFNPWSQPECCSSVMRDTEWNPALVDRTGAPCAGRTQPATSLPS